MLTDQKNHQGARNYWKVLKFRLLNEGDEPVTNCNRLKLLAEHGKMKMTLNGDYPHFTHFTLEGCEVVSITNQLKLISPDGKMRMTDVVGIKSVSGKILTE